VTAQSLKLQAESVLGRDKGLCLACSVGCLSLQEEIDRAVKLNSYLCFSRSITGEYFSPLLYLSSDIVV